ncbi:nucleotide-binding protein [Pseudomonas aeruginosa]|nr:nucleotide-binding protein [Pseudomonas aeruginosa]
MPSFDVVSELDKHELTNAVDNAIKELDRRFDLKGKCSFEAKDKSVTLTAEADFMLEQMLDILRSNLVKRKVDSQCMEDQGSPTRRARWSSRTVNFREGIDKDLAKKIVGPDQGAQAQGPGRHPGRAGARHRQEASTICRRPSPCCAGEVPAACRLQFTNFRD